MCDAVYASDCSNVTCRCCPGKEPSCNAVYFTAWQTGTLFNNDFNGGLVFENYDNSKGFCYSSNTITIFTPGVYAVNYTVYVPEGISLNTSFFLQENGINVPPSVIYVNHTADDPPITYSGQALIEVGCSPVRLRLSSSEIINYSTFDASALANLIIYKIGE